MGGWLASAVWNTDIIVGTAFNTRHTHRKYRKALQTKILDNVQNLFCVICDISCVICHMSCVICHMTHVRFEQLTPKEEHRNNLKKKNRWKVSLNISIYQVSHINFIIYHFIGSVIENICLKTQ